MELPWQWNACIKCNLAIHAWWVYYEKKKEEIFKIKVRVFISFLLIEMFCFQSMRKINLSQSSTHILFIPVQVCVHIHTYVYLLGLKLLLCVSTTGLSLTTGGTSDFFLLRFSLCCHSVFDLSNHWCLMPFK